jgi:hypothetical protein
MSVLGANRTRRNGGNDVNDPKQTFGCACLPYVVGYERACFGSAKRRLTQVVRRRRKLHIDFGVNGTSGRCALAPGVPCRSAITAQRGGEPEIIDDNIAQTVCR